MNWFDLVVVMLILLTLGKGFFSGLVMQIASLAGLVLGAIFAGQLSAIIAPWLISSIGASPHIVGVLSYIIAFIAILVALFFAGKLLDSFVDAIQMNTLNRLLGALFCCAKWVVIFSILLNLLVELDQNKQIIKEDVREQALSYPIMTDIAQVVIPYLSFDWEKEL
jgi:membrane protein required for colicin V production